MTVIGRLDEQVDAVLIAPLKRKQRADADAQEQAADEIEAAHTAPPVNAHRAEQDARPKAETELPVWLL